MVRVDEHVHPGATAHCAVCFTLFIHALSAVYAGPAPMWSVHVTAS